MGYTLMAARAGPQPIWVFTLTTPLGEPPERWRLAHVRCLEPSYNGIYPDGRSSRPISYTCLHPDDSPSGSLLKDGGSSSSVAWAQLTMGPDPTERVSLQSISGHTPSTSMETQLQSRGLHHPSNICRSRRSEPHSGTIVKLFQTL